MYRIFTLSIFLLLSIVSQGQYLKMATFAASGGTVTTGRNYMAQVLGQSSVISGTATSQGLIFRQGFKQPFGLQQAIARSSALQIYQEESPWSYETFPNPFLDRVTVRFDRPTANPVILQLYDIQGKVLWQGDYAAQTKEISLEKFQDIKVGKYILQVFQRGKMINQSIIKQSN
jgi:hypothetical protein